MSEFADILLEASRVSSNPNDTMLFALADMASARNDDLSTTTTTTESSSNAIKTIKVEDNSTYFNDRRSRSYSEPVLSEDSWSQSFKFTGPTLPLINENSTSNDDTAIIPTMLEKYSTIYNRNGRIGIYTREERNAIISKFHEKRRRRIWTKKIRYSCRKNLADRRVRVKGRFVKGSSSNNIKNEFDYDSHKSKKVITLSNDSLEKNTEDYRRDRSNSNIDVLATAAAITMSNSKDDMMLSNISDSNDDFLDEDSEEQFLRDFLSGKLTMPINKKRRHTIV